MRKYRSYSAVQRVLSALLCLSMLLSVMAGMDLQDLFPVTENVNAEGTETPDPNEYKDETLEHMWDDNGDGVPNPEFLDAARPYYACRDKSFGGVKYRTIFHVYAFEGDTICIGSSVANSKIDINFGLTGNNDEKDKGSVDVVMTDLNGVAHAIDIRNSIEDDVLNQTGYIGNWQTEWAAIKYLKKEDGKFSGTYIDTTGATYTYTPYTYTVTETGVYTFEFHSYNKNDAVGDKPGYRKRNEPFQNYKTNYGGEIAAINLTVFNESGEEQHGRTYADFLSLQMHPDGKGVVDSYYILTTDSYIYKMTFNDAKPYTYNFFSNNKGLYDPATGEIIYTSVKDVDNNNSYARMGAAYKYPGTKDTDMLKSFYIFLEYPDDQLEGEMYEKPVPPDPATNLRFVSKITDDTGNTIPGAYEGEGGYFAFDVEEATTATLRLEFKSISGEVYAPVEISGAVTPHTTNYFYWNGKDGNGDVIKQGDYSVDDLTFTITTKAGEIHFPIIDMEYSTNGITFTRLSHIYNKDGVRLDYDDNIYGKTKHLIYYDDTAIYYGEPAASTGFSEADVKVANGKFITYDGFNGKYCIYKNMDADGGEGIVRNAKSGYVTTNKIRVGDHSHTTNVINYFNADGSLTSGDEQKDIIEYLNSSLYPVGKASGSGGNSTTTDYAISNFWTFIPAKPATASVELKNITIKERPENFFNLTGRVFFDADGKGTFDDMSENGDYALSGVTLNLYKETSDTSYNDGKTYVSYNASSNTVTKLDSSNFASLGNRYELVDTGNTTGDGMYKFTGLEYDPTNGTKYLYQVVKPLNDYTLTTGEQFAKPLELHVKENNVDKLNQYYGYYANKSFNNTYTGTEVQEIVVGGSSGVNPEKMGYVNQLDSSTHDNPDHTVCAVDVGYNYTVLKQSLVLKKIWDTTETHPTAVAYEVRGNTTTGSVLYNYRVMSAITSWQHDDEYLPQELNGSPVNNYYVAAEYYIKGGNIYKHKFDYNTSSGKYESFVGKTECASLSELSSKVGKQVENFSNIPDLSVLSDTNLSWTTVNETEQPYKAVLDRNIGSDSSTITITNAKEHGTIEIFKYQGTKTESNALQGATFRIYELKEGTTVNNLKNLVAESEKGNTEATNELKKYQVGSATTRSNGRVAFPGLDPTKTYFIREVFAPSGFRIMNPFYVVYPSNSPETTDENEGIYKFSEDNYVKVDVGNAPADKNFYILKEIDGRAWQTNDSFSFTVLNGYENNGTSLSDASGIKVDITEQSIINGSTGEDFAVSKAEEFANKFKATSSSRKNIITIDNGNEQYHYTAKDKMGNNYEYTYPNRKMSNQLLVDGSEYDATTEKNAASFCGVEFPMAGVYTFTIKENEPTVEGDKTLAKSEYEFTVIINVIREANEVATTDLTLENSHLVAEVTSITYKDTSVTDSISQIYAGSSPLFTNTYAPAPAKQDTNYSITKNFTGRTDNEWLESDKFTVRVSGVNSETQDAIKNNNIAIAGFGGAELNDSVNAYEWVHEFNRDNQDEWDFTSFTFDNIMFPVQYVKQDSEGNIIEVWDPDKHNGELSPPKDEMENYKPRTLPVTYWLKIAEDIPEVTNGITYDEHVYYLQIILRNAEEKISTGAASGGDEQTEEEDGIIDEIDMNLYHVDKTVSSVDDIEGDPVATCRTVAEVLDEDAWKETPATGEGTYTWFYVDKDGVLHEDTTHTSKPADAKLLVRRWEKHDGDTESHTMTFSNIYHTSFAWSPTIKKKLEGRDWTADDKFTFTIECTDADKSGLEMPSDNTVTINQEMLDHKGNFAAIKFTQPGEYHFTITEKDEQNNRELGEYKITVTVTDDGKGKLIPTITGFEDSEINNEVIEFINHYADTSFDLNIEKTIEGRDWKDTDKFTFKITPDSDTKKAIDDKIIEIPAGVSVTPEGDSYTITLSGNTDTTEALTQKFGTITIKNTGTPMTNKKYQFTIEEITDDLEEKNMYCREPKIELHITVNSESTTGGTTSTNKLVATFAHIVSGGTPPTGTDATDKNVTIPFTNVAAGTLTVGKKVVSNAKEDTTLFDFEVTFTYDTTLTAKADRDIKVNKDGTDTEITKSADDKTWTYKFKLQDGQSVEFSNISPKTKYKITETIADENKDKYVLLRVRDGDEDSEEYKIVNADEDGSFSGTINPDGDGENNNPYRLFVNGIYKELPSGGDKGIEGYIFYGTVLTVGAIVLLAVLYFKRRKRRGSAE